MNPTKIVNFKLKPKYPPSLPGQWLKFSALVWVALFCACQLLGGLPYQHQLQVFLFDNYQIQAPRERESAPVLIVDIDESSLQRYGQWPWPRNLLAQLLTKIATAQPVAIGLDIIMPEADRSSPCTVARYLPQVDAKLILQVCSLPSNDAVLATALSKGPTILGVAGLPEGPAVQLSAATFRALGTEPQAFTPYFPSALKNLASLDAAATGHAALNTLLEAGIVRRVPLVVSIGDKLMPSLALEMLRLGTASQFYQIHSHAQGIYQVDVGSLVLPTQKDGSLWVHYGHHDAQRFIAAGDILEGKVDLQQFTGKWVLLGVSGLGLVDKYTTSLREQVAGVEIHAQLLEAIYDQNLLQRPVWAPSLETALVLLLGLGLCGASSRLNPLYLVALVLTLAVGLLAAGYSVFLSQQWLIDVATPIAFSIVLLGILLTQALLHTLRQRQKLQLDLQEQRLRAAKFDGEMEAASRIQMGICPNPHSVFPNEPRLTIAAKLLPAKAVGGDFYDFFRLDADRVFFILGDVCGKGIPASLFMAISKTLVKSLALRNNLSLANLVTQANLEISRDNSEFLFVTAFLGIINLATGELEYCNAGHEKALLISALHPPQVLESMGGPAICMLDEFQYVVARQHLRAGEFLCLVSDGITEAFSLEQQQFGQERLFEVLNTALITEDAGAVVHAVYTAVHDFAAGAEASDDISILVLGWRGANLA